MLTLLLLVLLAPLLAVNLMFVAELLFGLKRAPLPVTSQVAARGATIVVPAHNEEQVIERTLMSLKAAAGAEFDILVVADNCSDSTAAIAREQGTSVVERTDSVRRGKGFALNFAREWLRRDPPAAVIVLDADCRTDTDSLRQLAAACLRTNTPWQAINLIEPDRTAPAMVQISTFAFLIKNLVRQRGLQRLSGAVHLTGTGMCLPWSQFDGADLATASIVEDIRLGVELSRAGAHPRLAEGSFVWSAHADLGSSLSQRSRWEGGYLAMARAAAPEILSRGLRSFAPRTVLSGMDLLIPPLAMLAMLNVGALLLATFVASVGLSNWMPPLALAGSGALAAVALMIAWWREGRDFLSLQTLLKLPMYALWKIPMYAGLARKGAPSEWLRTKR